MTGTSISVFRIRDQGREGEVRRNSLNKSPLVERLISMLYIYNVVLIIL